MNLQEKVNQLFENQLHDWDLARLNFKNLELVRTKTFEFDNFSVKVQFNPARMNSSGASLDAKTLAQRPCFLCESNRPAVQETVNFADYSILVNPFPILPQHFTIPRNEHVSQLIKPYFKDLLLLAEALPDLLIFYNGPKCGASAPDHMHFQAGTKDFLPLFEDYRRLKVPINLRFTNDFQGSEFQVFSIPNYLRTVICIESHSIEHSMTAFNSLYQHLDAKDSEEPMMNIVCSFEVNKWRVFIFPRGNFRPWQFSAEKEKQLIVSPATVEMSGVFITPIEAHFDRINRDDVADIFSQSTRSL